MNIFTHLSVMIDIYQTHNDEHEIDHTVTVKESEFSYTRAMKI